MSKERSSSIATAGDMQANYRKTESAVLCLADERTYILYQVCLG